MKKLLFATAIAASVAALADPINAVDFEDGAYTINAGYFYFAGESDSSVVSNDATAASTTQRTAYFAEANNAKFLALDTEGGTLWRSLDTIKSETVGEDTTYSLGDAQPIAATGTYLDTLVQFTVTEDEAPTVGEGDKLAIWLQAGEGTTNLMVRAGYYNAEGTFVNGGKDFVLSGVTVEPGQWCRLTVKAIDDVVNLESEYASFYKLPIFTIQINGTYVTATEATLNSDFVSGLAQSGIVTQGTQAEFVDNKKFFLSLVQGAHGTASTLQGVGFQGTGAVDEIVWTEDDPFAVETIDFTLTWTASEVSAVSYVLSTDLATTNSLTSGTAVQLAPGDGTATIELIPTFASGYEFDKVTMGETDLGLTFAIPGVTTNATLFAKAAAPEYPTYVGDNATLKTQYDTWKTTYGADSESAYEKQFLLNVASDTTVADDALQIDSITENATAGWDIVVSTTVTGAALSDGSTTTYNGYLLVKSADTLAGLATAAPTAYPVTAVAGGKVSINVTSGKFMKVELTTTAPAQN